MKIEALDPSTPLMRQFQEKTGPITLVNVFDVPPELYEEFLKIWQEDAAYMKGSPGCIQTQLHKGTAGSRLLVNVAVWESTEALLAAFSKPEFQQSAAKYPDGITAYPHVYEKIAVEGICIA
ncbi:MULTISPECIES: antibiotic biosynthesis monooxygenase family protein [unclassified Streptomyces]|uniref:antibiotic biosynthesis monooxygenase family protein n=1 Tax=unclassified Streptomyces TaxID=2593676 RepID=UPI002DDB4B9B|nr:MULTISPECIES: antibiotic biosynthesis monooxygenase family protein [unclassified Streptomyces]WRZ17046.1 antibiotic biosynthesis monooxygenase [Streptomyces sp. NBC_00243]WRZ25618.1 antibiotic biosynthesis monooxygenase [Streptomyces sp. NBC_00243]WTB44062.1 antibiotic biosynthesis monooxygenase [Streptomyces sp. NBC_00827]